MVPGHEIVGIVRQVGNHANKFKEGDRGVVGSGAGGMQESQEMLDFCA